MMNPQLYEIGSIEKTYDGADEYHYCYGVINQRICYAIITCRWLWSGAARL